MEKLAKTIKNVDWFGVLTIVGWVGMGVYLWLKFWRII